MSPDSVTAVRISLISEHIPHLFSDIIAHFVVSHLHNFSASFHLILPSMDLTSTSPNVPRYYKCQYGRVELLRADNYPLWSSTLTHFLKADRTWKIVQGIERAPTPPVSVGPSNRNRSRPQRPNQNPSYRSLETQDHEVAIDDYDEQLEMFESRSAKACSMISSAVEDSYKQFIYARSDPKDMWDTLKIQLDSTNSDVGPFVLQSQFRQERHESGPIAVFLAKLQEYQTRLVATDYQIRDIDLKSHVLSPGVLPTKFERIVDSLSMQAPTLSWSGLTQTLINEEIRQNVRDSIKPTATAMIGNADKGKPKRQKHHSKSKDNSRKRKIHRDKSDTDLDSENEDHHKSKKHGNSKSK